MSVIFFFFIVNNLDIYTFYSNIVTEDMYFLSCVEIKTTKTRPRSVSYNLFC